MTDMNETDDDRFGDGAVYDEVLDADGNVSEGVSIDDPLPTTRADHLRRKVHP